MFQAVNPKEYKSLQEWFRVIWPFLGT